MFVNFAYIVLYAIRIIKRRDKKLQSYSANLEQNFADMQATNSALESTQSELYQSNDSLQEALGSVREISDQAQARAGELEKLTLVLKGLKDESDTIFNSVDHGLCLLDNKHKIGSRVSRAMYDIFETEHLTDRTFQSLLGPLITEKDLKTLDSYLHLQFNATTLTSELDRYNPLKQIEVTLSWDGDQFATKHLGFDFERIMNGDEIAAILVTITDVTETVALESKLKRASEAQERKTSLILEIIGSDARELELFLAQSEKTLDQINDQLKEQGVDEASAESSKALVEDVFRMVHTMKGNASMIGLESIVEILHKVESNLEPLRGRSKIKGEEFLTALVQLATLRERVNDYDEITQTILKDFALPRKDIPSLETKPKTTSENVAAEISAFHTSLAKDLGKKVYSRCQLDMDTMSQEGVSVVKDIMVQLSRNSLAHGIELPAERLKQGKLEEGIISIICEKEITGVTILGEPAYQMIFRDDGAGLNIEEIKKKAIQTKLRTADEVSNLSKAEIAGLIFEPTFSTADKVSQHAGRGVGMDIIKHTIVNELKGKLTLSFTPGNSMQIMCFIPIKVLDPYTRTIKTA